ncbi:SMC domain protein [Caldalkalibacillus thermarum TA2.A1]|uniref:Nuclease SbcCD subunit C n=1 Tax=Caldalkalibacillus thermarum (strain TA2.A1) TaxID=986075 RepID=F5L6X8_CALTT|nr:SbcC/MukB-like Walker B domain-containing protein [Caldalkalibacillus thermarum]EGL82913.1 SMC domain protein [Caldalkalibacillus thermarum TA2.A1]
MRPVALTVQGLHSFREKQEVDFTRLCEGGVFGIFGPTGSGKSSLLDAMTLALYGKVERAANNTQGIINHAEDKLAVSFTFELSNAQETKRYRVERSYRRSGDLSVKTAACRLVDVTAEPVVLADKTSEVNRKIGELLGLSSEDFTRAVVLPQGKFAEFLSLKGSERRQMLQRLFNLEKYGDQLRHTLSQRLQEAKSELNEVWAEQAGLGDASREALEAAKHKLHACEQELKQAVDTLAELEKKHAAQQKIWEWQQEKDELDRELKKLDEKQETIQQLEQKLKRAEQAKALYPYMEEYEASQQAVQEWEEKQEQAETALGKAQRAYEESKQVYEQAQRRRTVEEPRWTVRREQLRQAEEIEQRLKVLSIEQQQLEEQISQLETKRQHTQRKLEKEKDLLRRGEERQQELKAQLAQCHVPAELKEQVYQAYQDKREINHVQQTINELRQEQEEKAKQLRQERQKTSDLDQSVQAETERLGQLFKQSQKLYDEVCERDKQLEHFTAMLEREAENKQQALEREKVAHLARELAQNLEEGKPCPVCGSTHHPAPQTAPTGAEYDLEKDLKQLTELINEAAQYRNHLQPLKWRLEQTAEQIVELLPKQEISPHAPSGQHGAPSGQHGAQQPWQDEIAAAGSFNLSADHVLSHKLEQAWQELKDPLTALKSQVDELEQRVKQTIKTLRETKQAYDEQRLSLKAKGEEHQALTDKLHQATLRLEAEIRRWKEQYPRLSLETIEAEQQRVSKLEKDAEELRQRLEKSIPFIEEKERNINELSQSLNQLEVELAGLNSQRKEKQETIRERKVQLEQITHGRDLQILIAEANNQLERLAKEEQQAREAYEQAQRAWQTAEKQLASAIQAWNEAQKRQQEAQARWQQLLSQSPFEDSAAVKAALLPDNELDAHKQSIEAYYDARKQLVSHIQKLEKQLDGRHLSEEEWQETTRRLYEAKQKVDAAREARGAALKMLNELEKRHERYRELQKREEELTTLVDQYEQLQQVLRGNAFVEYLAEEQLVQVSRDASERLKNLTRGRYAIEVDSAGGFVIRDDANGGVKRPVSSLSGGETFLTSLALALSLSASIQLRGQYPLQFFFLDEGFGTLDQELLDTVVSALEKLQSAQMSVGVISHVPELRARLPRKLIVEPAEPGGRGSRVRLETF